MRFIHTIGLVVVVAFLYSVVCLVTSCGYKLAPADVTTLQLQTVNCAAAVTELADAGPAFARARSIDRVCVCGARGILSRAGQPLPDAGREGCPQ